MRANAKRASRHFCQIASSASFVTRPNTSPLLCAACVSLAERKLVSCSSIRFEARSPFRFHHIPLSRRSGLYERKCCLGKAVPRLYEAGVLPRCVLLKEHQCFAQKSTYDGKKVHILSQFWYKTLTIYINLGNNL